MNSYMNQRITRELVIARPETTFVIGTDLRGLSDGGLVGELEGLSNVVLVPVLNKHCLSSSQGAFFTDDMYNGVAPIIENILRNASEKGTSFYVHSKIGEGCSRLAISAPRIYRKLRKILAEL